MFATLRRLFARPVLHPTRTTRLTLESLEDRCTPSTIATAGGWVYVIRPDNSVWAQQGTGDWLKLTDGGFAASVSAAHEASGQNVVYALTTGGWLFQYRLGGAWQPLGAYFNTISAGTDTAGHGEVFALTAHGGLYEFVGGGVRHLGEFITSISAAGNGSVLAVLANQAGFEHTPQGWVSVSDPNTTVALTGVTDATGNQVLFAMSPTGFISTNRGGTWRQLIGAAGAMASGTDASGSAALFAVTGQIGPHGQTSLFEITTSSNPAFIGYWVNSIAAADGDTFFAVLSDHSVYEHTNAGWLQLAPAGFAIG